MQFGKKDLAGDLGGDVVPLAAEFTQLRLELRRGEGARILEQSRDVAARALVLLNRIRGEY